MSTRVSSPVLVGRAEQLATLEDALGRVRRGDACTVLVGGEAGVGKSRLISEFAGRITGNGVRVLAGGCLDLGADGPPFAPFIAVLRELVRDLGAEAAAELVPGRGERELARLLPEFGPAGEAGGRAGEAAAGEARARLFEEMLTLLEHLGERGPVAVLIEDLHWADRSTRDLLSFLVGNQRVLDGILVVGTFRSDDMHRTHPLRPLLAQLDRVGWVERLELPRLSVRGTHELVAGILGEEPAPELVDAVYRRTEGNPLFAEALLCCEGQLSCGLPESLRDLLMASVQRLPENAQEILRVASAAGDQVGHGLLGAVAGLDEIALVRALRPAVTGNVLLTDADGYRFRHTLIREAVHEDLLPGERTGLHARYATAIDKNPALVPPGRAAIQLAHHWYVARDTGGALTSAWRAAGEAARALAYAEQLAMVSRVLELWDMVPDAAERIGADHVAVLEQAMSAAERAGEPERGIGFAKAALKEVDAAADPVRAALLLEERSHLLTQSGKDDGIDDLREALRLVPADPPSEARARVLVALAGHLVRSNDAEAQAAAQEAAGIAREVGGGAIEAEALVTQAAVASHAGEAARSLELLARAREIAERARAYRALMHVVINTSDVLEGIGEHKRAASVARRGIGSADEYGLARTSGAFLAINLAEPLISLGRWDEAAEVIEHALELFPTRKTAASLRLYAAYLALGRGDLDAVAESLAVSAGFFGRTAYKDQNHLQIATASAVLRLAQGRPADALAVAENVLDSHDLQPSPRYAWPLLVVAARASGDAARVAVITRDEALARRSAVLLSRLRAQAEKLATPYPVQQARQLSFTAEAAWAERVVADPGSGVAGRAAGLASRSSAAPEAGTDDEARILACRLAWEAAAAAWDRLSQPYQQAGALLRAAEAAVSAGDRDAATQMLRRAAALSRGLGARPLADEIAVLARRARIFLAGSAGGPSGSPGSAGSVVSAADGSRVGLAGVPGSPAGYGRFGLTGRELEVLQLVAAGRSNRQIAEELFISVKTASVHVSNILGKLGVSSRGEAAATALRAGLFDIPPAA